MSPPWIKQRGIISGMLYERVDGWWLHHVGEGVWCLHNGNGTGVGRFSAGIVLGDTLFVIANNFVLHAEFKGKGHVTPKAWKPNAAHNALRNLANGRISGIRDGDVAAIWKFLYGGGDGEKSDPR